MKALTFLTICFVIFLSSSCKTKTNNQSSKSYDQLCSIKPNDWTCSVIEKSFDSVQIPQELSKPVAIIEFAKNDKSSQSVYLYLYDISKKTELEKIIKESMVKASCVPLFFGENESIYVVTSSCYVNNSFFSANSNLKPAIAKIFTKYDESIIR